MQSKQVNNNEDGGKNGRNKKMIDSDFVGIVVNGDQKKFLYRKIDASLILSHLSGALLGLGICLFIILSRPFTGSVLVVFSFILFFTSRYIGLKILFDNPEKGEDDDE